MFSTLFIKKGRLTIAEQTPGNVIFLPASLVAQLFLFQPQWLFSLLSYHRQEDE